MKDAVLSGLASRFLSQDQDLAFSFQGASGDFVVVGFEAQEAINAPFTIRIELASHDPDINLHDLMDAPGALGIFSKYDAPRFLHGIVTEIERGDSGIRRTFYRLTLQPALTRLDHGSDSRIWQAKSVPEIAKEVLSAHGIMDVDWRLDAEHAPREYLTQYRETHRAFLERILAEEGIFYFFEHSEGGHRMIVTDAPLATPVLPHAPEIGYNPRPGGQSRGSWVSRFAQRERLRSSSYTMNDYTFHNPPARMLTQTERQESNGLKGSYALYDYPGRYKDPSGVGAGFTRHRMEATRVDATTGDGQTNNIHLSPGYHFSLTGHDAETANGLHFLLSVSHSGQQAVALEEDAGDAPTTYEAGFTTMPGRLPYRPELAHKPLVDGPQIAIVTGPEGEEIYCDAHGRIKVWFPWDRHGGQNEHSSCWVRVSQSWAGGTWGNMAIPRIGHEVVVDYLEGDPDQPIVTGRTYHASNKPPYKLPENKTRMIIRSDSHKTPYKGFNELSFEDQAYNEEIYFRAQKDMNIKVRNDRTKVVDHDETVFIGRDKMERVRGTKHASIRGGYSITVSASEVADQFSDVVFKKNDRLSGLYNKFRKALSSVGHGSLSLFVESLRTVWIGGADTTTVGAAKTTSVGGQYSILTGAGFQVSSGTKHSINARTIDLSAAESVHINVGESRFSMEKGGTITLKGKQVNIVTEAETNLETGGSTKIESSGETAVYGSKIKLN